jgi:Tol biopolymer transport system component
VSKLACLAAAAFVLAGSSQTGGSILFWTDSPIPSLRMMRTDGTHVRRIAADQNAKRPSLSPDRERIAFDGTPLGKPPLSDFDVQIVRVDGTQRRTVAGTSRWELDAQWSPDGRRLSFSRMPPRGDWTRSVVCVVNVDGSGLKALGPGQGARWFPDGKKLVFTATSGTNAGDLFAVNADGSGRELLLSSGGHKAPAGWSRDGKHLLFTQWHDSAGGVFTNGDVYVVDAGGSHARRLTSDPAEDIAGDWSPDGRKVLFTSDRNGRSQIFVMNVDRTHLRNLSGERSNEFDPSWR